MSLHAFDTKLQPGCSTTPATLESGARGGVPRVDGRSADRRIASGGAAEETRSAG